jgi:hypothetical protein
MATSILTWPPASAQLFSPPLPAPPYLFFFNEIERFRRMEMVDMAIARVRFSGRTSRSVFLFSKCSDLDNLGPDCEWIGPNIEFCLLKATSVEKQILPA